MAAFSVQEATTNGATADSTILQSLASSPGLQTVQSSPRWTAAGLNGRLQ